MAAAMKCCILSQTLIKTSRQRHLFQINRHLRALTGEEEFEQKYDKDGFREFDLYQVERNYKLRVLKSGKIRRKKFEPKKLGLKPEPTNVQNEPSSTKMTTDQTWPDAWPTAKTFLWSQVPFDVRQSYAKNRKDIQTKRASLELMKIPNFLHLTPPHIKAHCQALKKLCTPFPHHLDTIEICRKHFPLEVITADYVFSSPSIRDPRGRTCTVKFKLKDLKLDNHARDKFIRLVEDRYDRQSGLVTFVVDRCPTKKQNFDFAMYLLTAVYFESWTTEEWEKDKELTDWRTYQWDKSESKRAVEPIVMQKKEMDQAAEKLDAHMAYVNGFPGDVSLEKLTQFFEEIAPIDTVTMRNDEDGNFNGSVFVTFRNPDDCERFLQEQEVKYDEVILNKELKKEYVGRKKEEDKQRYIRELKKKARQKRYRTPGFTLHLTQITSKEIDNSAIRKFFLRSGYVREVDFQVGDHQAWIRFWTLTEAKRACKKLLGGPRNIGSQVKGRILEGEEEMDHWLTVEKREEEFAEAIAEFYRSYQTYEREPVEDPSERAVVEYKEAVSRIFDQGENIDTLTNYKNSVLQLYNISSDPKDRFSEMQ